VEFMGYRRLDGSVGIRNKVLILPTVACAAETAKAISSQVVGTVTVNNQLGCGQMGADAKRTFDILAGLGKNPNIYGVVVVGLGCETIQPRLLAEEIKKSQKPVELVIIQEEGGTLQTILQGVRYAVDMVQKMSCQEKEICSVSDLVVALECGGSDPTSGIASNPAVGEASDMIISHGGTTILSETTEFIGAEHILAKRAVNPSVGECILKMVNRLETSAKQVGGDLRGGNPAPGNIAGGITTLEEKSLGCIYKGGSSPVVEVIEYGVKPSKKGLIVMDSPGYDVESVVGMVASGAQLCVFTTGRGTPLGNSIVPVIKVVGNPLTYEKMKDNMDIDASEILLNGKSIRDVGLIVFNEILQVANGKMTKAEIYGFSEMGIWRCGMTV
jgi:altronate dehydratase large subunit